MKAVKVKKKDGVTVTYHFFPLGRGVITRKKERITRLSVYVSDMCMRTRCVYPVGACYALKTCKNCKYKMK